MAGDGNATGSCWMQQMVLCWTIGQIWITQSAKRLAGFRDAMVLDGICIAPEHLESQAVDETWVGSLCTLVCIRTSNKPLTPVLIRFAIV